MADEGREPVDEYAAVFRSSPVGMALLDEQGRFAQANPALCRFLGRDAAWLVGRTPADLALHQDGGAAAARTRSRLRKEQLVGRVRARYVRPDGSLVHVLVSTVALPATGTARRTLAQFEDVTERVRQEAELERRASHDALTGLPGRGLLLERLREALEDPGAGAVAVAFVDLDAFKLINDALGHGAGDAVLQAVARRFSGCVGPRATVGRLAGDEFLVVAPVASEQEARQLAERLEASLRVPVPYGGDEVFVSCSLGLAVRPPAEGAADGLVAGLLAEADAAMYQAKRSGRRRYEVFDSAMRDLAAERLRLAAMLQDVVAEGRLVVHYQPVVTLPGLALLAVEAVVRVRDDGGALLLPAAFLEVAEQTGVLPEIDAHVLRTATAQVQRWRDDTGLDLHLSVNAGAGQVRRSLPEQVEAALAASGLPAQRLCVELAEKTFIDAVQTASDTLQRLVATGVNLAIDDFGRDWASLTYLRQFPGAAVKLDRSFVSDLPEGPQQDGAVVRALAELAHQLGFACVVEGIETPAQLARVLELLPHPRCYGQGYLFGAPLPPDDVARLLLATADRATA